ncbi:potassium channel family protein [Microbacterium sp. 2FI]|uniref:potassium channel family protein n=1 Tax=Microbacterium sp. 2FI TaxID=2502193 RepID=UPI0010F63F04|nr:potassium channel family protein [Microbacterium sp. 2FI]
MNHDRWERLTEWPLILASVLFLATYTWQVIGNPTGAPNAAAETILWATWGLFLLDYVANLVFIGKGKRWRWFYTHLFDLAVVVLPLLRPLRILRLVTLLTVLQRTAGTAIRGRISIYVASAAALLIYVAALAVYDSERGQPGTNITSFGDALWWSFVTVTTVGYGDFTPITVAGRLIAVGLMIGGIALLGVVTATLASWIVEKVADRDAEQDAATVGHIKALERQIADMQSMLAEALRR